MPGFYSPGEYDVAGFAVGAVKKEALVDGSGIAEGDALLGFASSGVHSNGFSLVRRILDVRPLHAPSLPSTQRSAATRLAVLPRAQGCGGVLSMPPCSPAHSAQCLKVLWRRRMCSSSSSRGRRRRCAARWQGEQCELSTG